MTVAEGGIRSPLLMAGPGVEGGRQVNAFAYVTDVMPTLLGMAGLEAPKEFRGHAVEPMRGRSMVGVLSGAERTVYDPDVLIGGEMGNGMWMRQGRHKAVSVAKPYGTGTWKLFDVERDPGETRDLSKELPEVLEKLKSAWERYAQGVGVVVGDG